MYIKRGDFHSRHAFFVTVQEVRRQRADDEGRGQRLALSEVEGTEGRGQNWTLGEMGLWGEFL